MGMYPMCTGFIKSAILLQFLRLIDPKSRLRKVTIISLILTALWTMAYGFICWFPCFPVAKAWNPALSGHCYGVGDAFYNTLNYLKTALGQAASNMVLDLIIFGIAIYMIWKIGSKQVGLRIRLGGLIVIALL